MVLSEYNEAKTMKNFFNEGRAEGGNMMLYSLVADGDFPLAKAAKKAEISEEQFRINMSACGYKVP